MHFLMSFQFTERREVSLTASKLATVKKKKTELSCQWQKVKPELLRMHRHLLESHNLSVLIHVSVELVLLVEVLSTARMLALKHKVKVSLCTILSVRNKSVRAVATLYRFSFWWT